MKWPEQPTCHDADLSPFARAEHMIWRDPNWNVAKRSDEDPYEETFRTCGYCGSIHPEDLMNALQNGASLHGSDWKYGWPHKFYVEGIPNPRAGVLIPQYTYCGLRERLGPDAEPTDRGGWREKTGEWPAPSTVAAKTQRRSSYFSSGSGPRVGFCFASRLGG